MMNKISWIVIVVGCCIGMMAGPYYASTASVKVTNLNIGQAAPRLDLMTLSGKSVLLTNQDFPLLVTVFTTWCTVCKGELDYINSQVIATKKSGNSLSVIAINAGESQGKVEKYSRKKGLVFPIYLDPVLVFTKTLGLKGTPTILLFDADQKLVFQGSELPANWIEKVTRIR